ncbi:hypothetical protein EXIGLDRAFT_721284 [Exidia glandulosa HHB12029]|uniref:Uncharacterized protein n=1 Tax=Exidia glandulosa HHB12029 TaxID=1314781 RepID=A0A165NBM3_EXIGL|nr:hypothetical protein EXIGLDRAFT_721284 [Exidia glandulosa HHB12029]
MLCAPRWLAAETSPWRLRLMRSCETDFALFVIVSVCSLFFPSSLFAASDWFDTQACKPPRLG